MALGEWCSMAGGRRREGRWVLRRRGSGVCRPAVGIQNARRVWGSPLPPAAHPTYLLPCLACLALPTKGTLFALHCLLWLQR